MFGFGLMETLFPIIFFVMFGIILCVFIFTFARGISQWNKNNHSPRLTVDAFVATKREEVTHHHSGQHDHMSSSTWYYVTFQVESGDRIELGVSGGEYGMLCEEDYGRLTFQGTRYLGFERR